MYQYKVILMDDEPAALNLMQTIVQKRCPQYQVVATAENGVTGLQKIDELDPDLVICDIKMPVMDGLEVLRILKREYPLIRTIIVSGYQDFEYVKEGLVNGVCDYILKPVVPSTMEKTLETVAEQLQKDCWRLKNKLISQLCCNYPCEERLLRKAFRAQSYYAAILRRNGLPRRFLANHSPEIYSEENEHLTIYGRDEAEVIYLVPADRQSGAELESSLLEEYEKLRVDGQYVTMIYDTRSFDVSEILEKIQELYRSLNAVSTVGLSQKINLRTAGPIRNAAVKPGEMAELMELLQGWEVLLEHQEYGRFKQEVQRLLACWSAERRPQLWMEHTVRQIWTLVGRHCPMELPLSEREYLLEDAFCEATTAEELTDRLTELLLSPIRADACRQKIDSEDSFAAIRSYLEKHLERTIPLSDVCKRFGISQTYLEKLFRKYEGQSYNQCLTKLRMEKAIRIMKENRDYLVKDISGMVGIEDPFYFSRVFRAYTGQSPKSFMEQLEQKES